MLRSLLAAAAITISLGMYLPLWQRICSRKTTGDFSKLTQLAILILQFLGLGIALLENARFLTAYYTVQIILVSITTVLIWRYYNER